MDIKEFAAEVFDVFSAVCMKYKIDFNTIIKQNIPGTVNTVAITTPVAKPATKIKKAKRIIAPELVPEFIKWFIKTPVAQLYAVKRGQWKCALEDNVWQLTFASKDTSQWRTDKISGHILAFKAKEKDITFVNAGRFTYRGSQRNGVAVPQDTGITEGAMPVPLRLITAEVNPPKSEERWATQPEAGLGAKVSDITVIDWKGPETFKVLAPRWGWRNTNKQLFMNRHFAGAMVLKIKEDYYLIDIERKELEAFAFIAFFTNLPKGSKPTTVAEAYDILEPKEVKGGMYTRQGELFFKSVSEQIIKDIIIKKAKDPKAVFAYDNIIALAHPHAAWKYNKEITERIDRFKPQEGDTTLSKLTKDEKKRLDGLLTYRGPNADKDDDYTSATQEELGVRLASKGKDGDGDANDGVDAKLGIRLDHAIQLRDMTNRESHTATLLLQDGDAVYVWGHIGHREHQGLMFDSWQQVYRNTASRNFNVSGEID